MQVVRFLWMRHLWTFWVCIYFLGLHMYIYSMRVSVCGSFGDEWCCWFNLRAACELVCSCSCVLNLRIWCSLDHCLFNENSDHWIWWIDEIYSAFNEWNYTIGVDTIIVSIWILNLVPRTPLPGYFENAFSWRCYPSVVSSEHQVCSNTGHWPCLVRSDSGRCSRSNAWQLSAYPLPRIIKLVCVCMYVYVYWSHCRNEKNMV
jgi:hypothetical protein